MGVAVVGMDSLSERAAMMRESLQKSQTITDKVVSILGSFDHRLSALETAMRPTQIRTHSIRKAHENIDKTLKVAEVLLAQFDLSRQVGFTYFLLLLLFVRSPRIVSCSFFFTLNAMGGISRTLGGNKKKM
ncbi:hypothetical protein I3843_13G035500 [Carya illinoinensis]|nr:hypothetical protein I3843_13G035500 [Carya illinoinensis]